MNILNISPVAIAAVILFVVLLLLAVWGLRSQEPLGLLAAFCLVWGIPIALVILIIAVVKTEIEQNLGLWIIAVVVLGVLAFLRDSGAALVGGLFGLGVGLLYVLAGWIFGTVMTFDEVLWFVGRLAIGGWIALPLMSGKR